MRNGACPVERVIAHIYSVYMDVVDPRHPTAWDKQFYEDKLIANKDYHSIVNLVVKGKRPFAKFNDFVKCEICEEYLNYTWL